MRSSRNFSFASFQVSKIISYALFPGCLIAASGSATLLIERGMPAASVSAAISATVFAMVAVFERLMPFDPGSNRSHGDVGADVCCIAIVAGGVESLIVAAYPIVAAAAYGYLKSAGMLGSGFPSDWPLLVQAVLLVLLADLAKYWFHRFGHETMLGWRLHSVHHAVKRVYSLNGFRIHPIYHMINFSIAVLPWVCLGMRPEVAAIYGVILAVSAAFQHANIDLRHGWLTRIFNTNQYHRWHHSRVLEESNANYGAVTLVWDHLFGSYRAQPEGSPAEVGMVNERGYPMHSYLRQLIVPFRFPK